MVSRTSYGVDKKVAINYHIPEVLYSLHQTRASYGPWKTGTTPPIQHHRPPQANCSLPSPATWGCSPPLPSYLHFELDPKPPPFCHRHALNHPKTSEVTHEKERRPADEFTPHRSIPGRYPLTSRCQSPGQFFPKSRDPVQCLRTPEQEEAG